MYQCNNIENGFILQIFLLKFLLTIKRLCPKTVFIQKRKNCKTNTYEGAMFDKRSSKRLSVQHQKRVLDKLPFIC